MGVNPSEMDPDGGNIDETGSGDPVIEIIHSTILSK